MEHQTKIIEKILSYVELENAGVDFMAYMTRSGKCESTSHGLHQYTNKKITPKGAWIWLSDLLKFLFPPKRWRRRQI